MASEILECPIGVFLDHYAPFKPSNLFVNKALEKLKASSLVSEVASGNNIVQCTLPKVTAAFGTEGATESTIFKNLEPIMRVLQNVKADGCKRSFFYKDCPTKNISSEIPGTDFKFDACITSTPRAKPIILADAAVIAEYKKASTTKDIEDVSSCSCLFLTPDTDVSSRIV